MTIFDFIFLLRALHKIALHVKFSFQNERSWGIFNINFLTTLFQISRLFYFHGFFMVAVETHGLSRKDLTSKHMMGKEMFWFFETQI